MARDKYPINLSRFTVNDNVPPRAAQWDGNKSRAGGTYASTHPNACTHYPRMDFWWWKMRDNKNVIMWMCTVCRARSGRWEHRCRRRHRRRTQIWIPKSFSFSTWIICKIIKILRFSGRRLWARPRPRCPKTTTTTSHADQSKSAQRMCGAWNGDPESLGFCVGNNLYLLGTFSHLQSKFVQKKRTEEGWRWGEGERKKKKTAIVRADVRQSSDINI